MATEVQRVVIFQVWKWKWRLGENNCDNGGVVDRVQPKMPPTISLSGMYREPFNIVGIGPILNIELEFIYQSDRSDRTYVYS